MDKLDLNSLTKEQIASVAQCNTPAVMRSMIAKVYQNNTFNKFK